jgi:hypothetical protein
MKDINMNLMISTQIYFNKISVLFCSVLLITSCLLISGCKKDEPAAKEDLYADVPVSTPSSSAINTFYQNTAFFQLFIYRYDPSTQRWGTRIVGHYPTISTADNSYMGFTNPNVADSGVPLFDMVRLYTTQLGSNNIKNAKINADKVLQFFPDFEGAKTGIVKILKQDIVLTRSTPAGTFKIGISGEGTYDETAKLIDLKVVYDETDIGGPGQTFQFKMSTTALTLNQ